MGSMGAGLKGVLTVEVDSLLLNSVSAVQNLFLSVDLTWIDLVLILAGSWLFAF